MMSLKRLFLGVLSLGVVLGLAGTAGAVLTKSYSLGGSSGGQLQVGGGLPLPIQAECNGVCTNTVFPPLLIGPKGGATVMATAMVGAKQKLVVPKGVLSKPAAFKILGQFSNNKNLYAVATNLNYTWPNTTATFSSAARTGPTTVVVLGGAAGQSIRYSNVLGRKFGGAAQFALSPGAPAAPGGGGPPGDLNPAAPVTLYAIPPPLRPVGKRAACQSKRRSRTSEAPEFRVASSIISTMPSTSRPASGRPPESSPSLRARHRVPH